MKEVDKLGGRHEVVPAAQQLGHFYGSHTGPTLLAVTLGTSRAEQLTAALPAGSDALAWPAPPLGTKLSFTKQDIYGRTISLSARQPVVAMPSCEACAMKRIDLVVLGRLSAKPIILIFPETLAQRWAFVKTAHWRVLVEGVHQYLPASMHDFAPTCAWVNSRGVVLQIDRTMDADGLPIGGEKDH